MPPTHNGAKQGNENPRFLSEKRWCGDYGAMTSCNWPYDVSSNKMARVVGIDRKGFTPPTTCRSAAQKAINFHLLSSSHHVDIWIGQ